MKKVFMVFTLILMLLPQHLNAALSVSGSTSPGTIDLGTINFGELLPATTIFFGAGAVPAHGTPTIIRQTIGTPVNERGFLWPRDNFVIFGDSQNFFTTGTGTIQFSSPSPAEDVGNMYSIATVGSAFVGSAGYAFPNTAGSYQDQAYGTYTVNVTYSTSPTVEVVNFSFKWKVNPRFKLLITDVSAGRGNFGSVAFGEAPPNQEFVLATQVNFGIDYMITLSTSGITNQFGTELQGVKVFSDGISGNRIKKAEIPISTATPVVANQEIVIYRSNQQGNSDFFNFGVAVTPPFGQQAGDYSGTLVLTLVAI